MADYKVTYKRYSGGSWNTIYFTTLADLVDDEGQENRFLHTEMDGDKRVLKSEDLDWLLNDSGLKDRFIPYSDATGNINLGTKILTTAASLRAKEIYSSDGLYLIPQEGSLYGTTKIETSDGGVHFSFQNKKTTTFGTNGSSFVYNDEPDLLTSLDIPHRGYIDTIKDNLESAIATGTKIVTAVRLTNKDTDRNITPSGIQSIDGISTVTGNRVLLRFQQNSSNNGVWETKNSGSWIKIEEDSDVGSLVSVTDGTTLKGNQYYASNRLGPLEWVKFNTHYIYQGDEGVTVDGVIIKLEDSGVTTSKLANGAVTETKLGNEAVVTSKLGDGAVTERKIATDAVTTNKIKNSAVTTDKLADGAVTEDKIADLSITGDKIADYSIDLDKLKAIPGQRILGSSAASGTGGPIEYLTASDVKSMLEVGSIYWQDTTPTGIDEGSIWLHYEELT